MVSQRGLGRTAASVTFLCVIALMASAQAEEMMPEESFYGMYVGLMDETPAPTPAPTTASPTPPEGCEDSASYTFQNNPKKTCAWAAKRPDVRCRRDAFKENCPLTCESCPDPTPAPPPEGCEDDAGFTFKNDPKKTCAWAAKRPEVRCKRNIFKENCPLTCENCPDPTPAPPPEGCEDDAGFTFQNNPKKTCVWASKRADLRCKRAPIKAACQLTCNSCATPEPTAGPTCVDNAEFMWRKDPKKTCEWASKRADVRCKRQKFKDECPATCDSCPEGDSTCKDDENWIFRKDPSKTCKSFVEQAPGDKKAERCQRKNIRDNCPKTCGACPTGADVCADDQTKFPKRGPLAGKSCKWAAKKDRCNNERVAAACPATCGLC